MDLIGEDISTPAPAAASSGPSTQDLLADIFGSSSTDTASASASAPPSRNANADIMSLFGGSSAPAAQSTPTAPASASNAGSLLDLVSSGPSTSQPPQAQAPAAAPAKSQLQSYPAYDKNGLKITLTPRLSPTQPGVVQILARFTASEAVSGVNLQVAVPKVSGLAYSGNQADARRNNYRCRPCLMRISQRARRRRSRCAYWPRSE